MADDEVINMQETNPLLSSSESSEVMISSTLIVSHSEPSPPSTSSTPPASAYTNGPTLSRRRTSSYNSEEVGDENAIHSTPKDEDVVDECTRLTSPIPSAPITDSPNMSPIGIDGGVIIDGQPKGGEYSKIMEMLKEAEAEADPDLQSRQRNMEFLTKYNPRGGPETRMSGVDYCCSIFQCCALCIEG